MATVNIYRNNQKKLKNGNDPIQLRICHKGKRNFITIGMNGKGLNGNANTFDDKLGLFNNTEPDYKVKNGVIGNKLNEALKILRRFEDATPPIPFTYDLFEGEFVKKPVHNNIIHFFDQEIERFHIERRYGSSNNYKATRDHLKSCNGSSALRFDQVNYSFLIKLETYHRARGIKKSTIALYMNVLRTVFNNAIKSGLCEEKDYPFHSRSNLNGYSIKHLKHESPKRAISMEQVNKIRNYELVPGKRQFEYRNYWLFMYYCRGMNFSDMADLEWSDIIEGRLQYNRNKNNRDYNIELIPEALEILEQYRGQGIGNYIFPIHNELQNTEARYYHRRAILKLMNKSMNRIAKKLAIDANITSYVARHTWATGLRNKGYSAAIIGEGLGHNSEKTTTAYLKKFENSILDEAGKDVL